jgi:hypothetical protein
MGLVSWIVVGGWPRSEWSSLAQSHFGDYPPDQFQKHGLALPGTQADRTEAKRTRCCCRLPVQRGTHDDIILVVEDDHLMRRLATAVLRDFGYTVFYSANAADALAILDNRPSVTDVVSRKSAALSSRRRPSAAGLT